MANLEQIVTDIDRLDANNPQDMESLIQAISGGSVDPLEATPAPKATPAEKAEPEPLVTEAKAEPAVPAIEDKAPVATRDGKHTIPYSVLEAARAAKDKLEADVRSEREQREALAKQLEEKLARIKELEAGTGAGQEADAAEAYDLKADLEAIAEEAPYLSGGLGKLVARVEAAEKAASTVQKPSEKQADDKPILPPEVRDAIDAVPVLAHWEASNAQLFAAATEVDNRLRARPEWGNKPMKERFEQVVKIMAAEYGDSILPPTGSDTTTPKPAAKTLPNAADVGINTLSDLPGGTPTSQSALQDMEAASASALANRLTSMGPSDIVRFVTR
jgi:hypothetical protein